ncbi:hypothetical protein TruAng_008890 [Truncatella angustata]|nr:hypothetical protein TruAng_008890 [Truncatella angustata]
MWRTTLQTQAARYAYLERGASSLWTLYQSLQVGPSSSALRADACRYNLEASEIFRKSYHTVTEQNWLAFLLFGVLVVIFQLAIAQADPDVAQGHMEVFQVLRSTSKIAQTVTPYFRRSPLKKFVDDRHILYQPIMDKEVWRRVSGLDGIGLAEDTLEDAEACRQAIAHLKAWVQETDGHPRSWAHFFRWPGAVSDHFTNMLFGGHQRALVIFVYWCAIMHQSPKRWFMDGWASRSAHLAIDLMSTADDHLLEWPRSVLSSGPFGYFALLERLNTTTLKEPGLVVGR